MSIWQQLRDTLLTEDVCVDQLQANKVPEKWIQLLIDALCPLQDLGLEDWYIYGDNSNLCAIWDDAAHLFRIEIEKGNAHVWAKIKHKHRESTHSKNCSGADEIRDFILDYYHFTV